jgi:hypothetical protein
MRLQKRTASMLLATVLLLAPALSRWPFAFARSVPAHDHARYDPSVIDPIRSLDVEEDSSRNNLSTALACLSFSIWSLTVTP